MTNGARLAAHVHPKRMPLSHRIAARLIAVSALVAVCLVPLSATSPSYADDSVSIHVNSSDFSLTQSAFYSADASQFISPDTTEFHVVPPTEARQLDIASIRVELQFGISESSLLGTFPNDGQSADIAVNPALFQGKQSAVIRLTGVPGGASKDSLDLSYSAPYLANQATSSTHIVDLTSSRSTNYSSFYDYSPSAPVTEVRPGQTVIVTADAPLWATGPDGISTDPQAVTGEIRSVNHSIYGTELEVNTASDSSSLEFTLPRPNANWADGDTAIRLFEELSDSQHESYLSLELPILYAQAPSLSVSRISGGTRYDVAVALSQAAYPDPRAIPVSVVYIAKGTDYPDALSAAPAAAKAGGPLLLTMPNELPTAVADEIARLHPDRIIVVGGPASVSPGVFTSLTDLVDNPSNVSRVDGADRYEVSRKLSQSILTDDPGQRVYVATGTSFPDALSASAAAGSEGDAVLLVPGSSPALDTASRDALQRLHPDDVVVAGGPNSVSPGILSAIQGMSWPQGALRISGADRFEASRNINLDGFAEATDVFIATGVKFPDALAGAAIAGQAGAPLYVVPSDCIPQGVLDDIRGFRAETVTLLGGAASLSSSVESLTSCSPEPATR